MTYPANTIGWLKYGGSGLWHRVEVLSRIDGSHTYSVRRSRTDFTVGPTDVLIVIG